jgi:hypothetical protein
LNNQNLPIEVTKFQETWMNFWNEDDFRQQTFLQLSKDFALSGIDLSVDVLGKCRNNEQLVGLIEKKIDTHDLNRLLYVIDLKEAVLQQETNFIPVLIQRVAFKVFLRNYLSTQKNS